MEWITIYLSRLNRDKSLICMKVDQVSKRGSWVHKKENILLSSVFSLSIFSVQNYTHLFIQKGGTQGFDEKSTTPEDEELLCFRK